MKSDHRILIGGGSGLVGSRLTALLKQKGYHVSHLGREAKDGLASAKRYGGTTPVKTFEWDIRKQTIDERAFEGVTAVINLAGANINGSRWTEAYKKELAISRIGSTQLLVNFINDKPNTVTNFISGSAIGYYGFGGDKTWFKETDPPGNDFLAQLVKDWEGEALKVKKDNVKVSIVRTGIVFASEGGALEEMAKPIKLFAGAPLASGKQVVSWVHIDDLCGMFIHILEHNLVGAFNGAAPDPANNERITKEIAKRLHRPLFLPNIPAFALKIILGEMSESVVNGSVVSSEKIVSTGFTFQYATLSAALDSTLNPQ